MLPKLSDKKAQVAVAAGNTHLNVHCFCETLAVNPLTCFHQRCTGASSGANSPLTLELSKRCDYVPWSTAGDSGTQQM